MLNSLPKNVVTVLTNYYSAVWLSCCNADKQPMIARLSSISIIDSDTIRCYIPAKFATELLPALIKHAPVSVMAACTETFDSYQVKGFIESVDKIQPELIEGQQNIIELFGKVLVRQGFSAENLYKAYADNDFAAVVIKVKDVFEQTPKTGTGTKINA
ncbi:hypothetical protein [Mucilaginibacter sp. L3T2-6]|uniref:hypothetical protein n=1 Tax=Mucilaginibacter sp. L3T2-6 TaxID=3062491 RepID=UPI002675BF62|nr:hypothetical protein [Mucilaginibacter sp. L3T2-6]MDO3642881.1 hypothetical protein [Mucilaginibacter sp. L3T2-6]MDV6215206.1 hypothetical protein [Mucilaginibacter sp. L3T2-6]